MINFSQISAWLGLSKPQVSFRFEQRESRNLGRLNEPIITVWLRSPKTQEWEKIRMLVDTGADFTILPRYLAVLLDIDLKKEAQKITTSGVGGDQAVYLFSNLEVKVGGFLREIPVGFSESNKIPPLMGRHHFFETFQVEFFKDQKITFRE